MVHNGQDSNVTAKFIPLPDRLPSEYELASPELLPGYV